jgi:histidinol-phosphate aminotransferase
MTDFEQFVPEHIRKLAEAGNSKPLNQGGKAVSKGGRSEDPVALNLNENPFGPSPRAIEVLHAAIGQTHRYPEIQATGLHEEIAAFHGVRREQVLVTAGATDLLCMIARALLGPGLNAVTSAKSFIVYKLATQVTEGKLIEVPTRENGYDLESIASAIDSHTRIVFIANPNNPTGTMLAADEVDDFVDGLPEHVLVVLDEAYGDFAEAFARKRRAAYSHAFDYIRADKNVILLKTFSKSHGLAGLRVGYGIGPERLISLFAPTRVIFSVSSVAQAAASAALHDSDHIRRAVQNNLEQAEVLATGMKGLGFAVPQTWANFLYCELKQDAGVFAKQLRAFGIVVQPLGAWGVPDAIRVSIGAPKQNDQLIKVLSGSMPRYPKLDQNKVEPYA